MKIVLQKVLPEIGKICEGQKVDCLVSRDLASIYYLTEFNPHSVGNAAILITPKKVILFSDERYGDTIRKIAKKDPLIKAVIWDRSKPLADVVKHVKKGQNLGFEQENELTSFSFVMNLKKVAATKGIHIKGTKNIVETIRNIKSPSEIQILKKAFALTDQAFYYILKKIKPGLTEIEIARLLGAYLRKISGCEELSFPTIVASGLNSATPHAIPKNRKLREGDPVTLDFGLIYNGYHSDMTRTIFIGEPPAKMRQIYDIVLEAQLAAAQQARIGMTGQQLDGIARNIITKAGYGKYFVHGTGHGVGLEEHEKPYVTKSNLGKNILEENTVFSIEPGIYIPKTCGVRIENVGVLTKSGFKSFSKSPKELIIL